jgi:hypothetical protein
MRKEPARKVWRRIILLPGNHIQNLKIQFRQYLPHRKDIMHRTTYPNRGILLHFIPYQFQPISVEIIDILKAMRFIPCTFVHTHYLPALYG